MKIKEGCRVQIKHGSYYFPAKLVVNVSEVIDDFRVRVNHGKLYRVMQISGVRLIDSNGRLV